MDVAVISGTTFAAKSVTYYDVDGIAIVEGDIALGTVEEVRTRTEQAREVLAAGPDVAFGVGITGSQFRWPNCQIPYDIDSALPNQQRVTDAIAHWEAHTAFRFVLRTPANASQFPNWVHFTDAGGCWSQVGMQGGQQTISLGAGCSAGNAIHEIGHTVGLWHEQSREDRDLFVTIHWEHIQDGMAAQFNQHITDGDDLGAYDYGSIMHYPRNAFSRDGQDTITPTDPNAQIGQRTALSAGDIAAVQTMYPGCHVKSPFLEGGVKKIRDEVPFPGIKKIRDDGIRPKKITDETGFPGVKKIRDETGIKKLRDEGPVVKPLGDKGLDPGPVKAGLDPGTGPLGTVSQPGVLQPFAIALPHQALVAGMGADPNAAANVSAVQRQLLGLDAELAAAQARAAQATSDAAELQAAIDALAAAYQQALDQAGLG